MGPTGGNELTPRAEKNTMVQFASKHSMHQVSALDSDPNKGKKIRGTGYKPAEADIKEAEEDSCASLPDTGQLVQWQWKHKLGWHAYPDHLNDKIEAAVKSGVSIMTLTHAEVEGRTVEIDFTTMQQHDRSTGVARAVQRQVGSLDRIEGESPMMGVPSEMNTANATSDAKQPPAGEQQTEETKSAMLDEQSRGAQEDNVCKGELADKQDHTCLQLENGRGTPLDGKVATTEKAVETAPLASDNPLVVAIQEEPSRFQGVNGHLEKKVDLGQNTDKTEEQRKAKKEKKHKKEKKRDKSAETHLSGQNHDRSSFPFYNSEGGRDSRKHRRDRGWVKLAGQTSQPDQRNAAIPGLNGFRDSALSAKSDGCECTAAMNLRNQRRWQPIAISSQIPEQPLH